MPSATFTVNGSTVNGAVAVAASSTVTLALVDTVAGRVTWSIAANHSQSAVNPTITPGAPPTTATFTMPVGAGQAYIVQCVVNGGVGLDGKRDPTLTFRAVVGVVNSAGIVPFAAGEIYERAVSPYGWTETLNAFLASGGAGLHASSHQLGGGDEIDGDQLGIDFTPANYTPSTAPAEVTNVDHLTAHLAGIDDALSGASASPLTTKGDLYTYDTSDARLPVGANGLAVLANSGTATGLEWGAPAPATHATTHEDGGSDALDGGNLAYAASPSNYTAGTATTGGHFSGIDTALGLTSLTDGSRAFTNPVSGVTPTADAHLTTKAYVDSLAQGLDVKPSVRAVATANQATLSGTAQTIDGFALNAVGMRVLLTAQSTATQNGIWVVQSGAWTRPTDFDTGDQAAGAFTFVESGTANADSGWVCTSNTGADVIDTDNLAWTQFSGAGQITAGAGLTKSGNTLDVGAHADGSIAVAADTVQVGILATDAQHGDRGGGTLHAVAGASAGFMPGNYYDTQEVWTTTATTADGDNVATGTTLGFTPRLGRFPRCYWQGQRVVAGGLSAAIYFSNDGGTTARTNGNVASGDTAHWNGSVAGFELAAGEELLIEGP